MMGLVEKVIFTGVRSDVPDIMMAMDVFIFRRCMKECLIQ